LQGTTIKRVHFHQPKKDSWLFKKSSSKKYYKGQPTTIIGHVLTLDLLNICIGLNGGAIGHVFFNIMAYKLLFSWYSNFEYWENEFEDLKICTIIQLSSNGQSNNMIDVNSQILT
jgi:hypothetical protein